MEEIRICMSENGRILVPAAFRRALGIDGGDELVMRVENDELRITTLKQRLARARQLVRKHAKPGTSPVDLLLSERRKASKSE